MLKELFLGSTDFTVTIFKIPQNIKTFFGYALMVGNFLVKVASDTHKLFSEILGWKLAKCFTFSSDKDKIGPCNLIFSGAS